MKQLFEKLIVICLMTLIIHAAETCTYAIRYAGVKTGKLAVSLSLAGILLLISRTSNLVQAPMMGKIIDFAKIHNEYNIELSLRYILGAASIGTMISIILFPSLIHLFSRVIVHFEASGSIPKLITSVTIQKIKNAKSLLRRPKYSMIKSLRIMGIPKRLLVLHCIVTAIYTAGVLAALYASYLAPDYSTTASQSSGLINGLATILLTIFIDPQMALLTDKAMKSDHDSSQLGKVFSLLLITRLIGTLLAQVILVPAAYWIMWIIKYI